MKSQVFCPPALPARWLLSLPLALALFAGVPQSRAAVINAASVSLADVSAAVSRAALGDTVLLPPGTNGWTSKLTLSGITLQGAGPDKTVILDETPIVTSG